jgi:hypothetical protein
MLNPGCSPFLSQMRSHHTVERLENNFGDLRFAANSQREDSGRRTNMQAAGGGGMKCSSLQLGTYRTPSWLSAVVKDPFQHLGSHVKCRINGL